MLKRRTLYRGGGPEAAGVVEATEDDLARLVSRKHALLVNSGTSAVLAALIALGVRARDEVVIPAYGWVTTLSAILHLQAVPVFAPIGADLNVDPERLVECLSPLTKLILPVHACGRPCDVAAVLDVARAHGVAVVDDACQGLGARIDGHPVGEATDASVFSFQGFKIATAGEGGALATDNEQLYLAAVRFHDGGLARFARPAAGAEEELPVGVGLNLRMSELAAAVIAVQLERLPHLIRCLRAARTLLLDALAPALEQGLFHVSEPRGGVEDNATFLLLRTADAALAYAFASELAARCYRVSRASDRALHSLPAWLKYLARERRPHRVVGRETSLEQLARTLLFEVNWQLPRPALDSLRGDVADVMRKLPKARRLS